MWDIEALTKKYYERLMDMRDYGHPERICCFYGEHRLVERIPDKPQQNLPINLVRESP